VPSADLRLLAASLELFAGVLSDRLQHRHPQVAGTLVAPQQALVVQG
jgi:hypothetical protein